VHFSELHDIVGDLTRLVVAVVKNSYNAQFSI
jgi:hypothetical protein